MQALQRSYVSRVKQQLLLLNTPYTADQVDAWEAAFAGWGLGDYLANSLPDTALRAAARTALRELDSRLERASPSWSMRRPAPTMQICARRSRPHWRV